MGRSSLSLLIFFLVISSFSAAGQAGSSSSDFILLRDNNKVHPLVKGFWKSIGSGYILDAATDSVLLYSYTNSFTYKEKNDYLEGLYNSQSRFIIRGDTMKILLTDFGKRSAQLQVTNSFIRIGKLPEDAISFQQMQQMGSLKLFRLFMETMKENYAFRNERVVNWDSINTVFGNRISDTTNNEKLFEILGEIVTLTRDHHTKIINESGRTLQFRGTKSGATVSSSFEKQTEIKNLNEYFNLFFQRNYKNISDSLLSGKGHKLANGQIEYGDLSRSVGYIHIYSFSGFAPAGFSRKQQIDSIRETLETIIHSFRNKKSLIVDISFNFGGYDAAALSIAGFFTNKPVIAYTSQVFNQGIFFDESQVYVFPSSKISFSKPVYVLMSDITRSAAEGFAMMMKVLPNVKLVGTNTMGILSGMLGKSIGEFYSTSSNQRLIDGKGRYYEVTGVSPDINKTIFRSEDIFRSHMHTVKALAIEIEK